MKVKELIQLLLDRPMTDNVVFHSEKKPAPGYWSDLENHHMVSGHGIVILDLEEKRKDG